MNESETDSASESEFEAQFKEISVQTNNPSVCTTSTQKDPSVCSKSTQKDCYCQLINCFAAQHVEKDWENFATSINNETISPIAFLLFSEHLRYLSGANCIWFLSGGCIHYSLVNKM